MSQSSRWALIGTILCLSCTMSCKAEDSLTDVLACRDISDATARLACFDRETSRLAPPAKVSVPSASATTRAAPAPIEPAQPQHAPAAQAAPSTLPAAPAPPTAPTSSPALNAQQQFGLSERAVAEREVAAGTRTPKLSRIEAHIVRTAHTSDGHLTFTLDNDEVWRELEAQDILVQPGEAVTISRASLGSFWLRMSSGRGCKVTRLR